MGDDDLAHVCFLPSGQHFGDNKIFVFNTMVKQIQRGTQTKTTQTKTTKKQTNTKTIKKKTQTRRPQSFTPCSIGDAREWCYNDNVNNYINTWERGAPMPLNYKLINLYLLTLHYPLSNNVRNKFVGMVNNMQEYAPNRNNIQNLQSHIAESIKRLYRKITSMPRMINHVGNRNSPVTLYHGSMLPHLKDLQVGDIYTTPIFMSTSVIFDVAARFARVNPTSADTAVVLRIQIPSNKLKEFQYMYFGDFVNLANCNTIQESEMLMNLHSNLRLEQVHTPKTVNYRVYGCNGRSLRSVVKKITFFDFTFIGHSTRNVNRLLNINTPKNSQ